MAIYHFSGSVISRSSGKSSIASAAYRSGEKLHDERLDKAADYSRKQDVVFKEVFLPEGAPKWMGDREKLWNAVERAENRKDAQLAREFNFSLPREFTKEQNIELAREFVQNQFVSKGMIADLCIHDGKAKDGEEQPHAHVMLTLREVTEEGFGLKERSWNAKENLLNWRESWADFANKHLALNGIDQRIDHKTLEEQGIKLEPQKKIGPDILRVHETRAWEHQRIARENGDKIMEDPNIALSAITYHKSTFTHQDLARFVNRHTIDADQFQMVYEKVKVSEQIIALGSLDKQGNIHGRGDGAAKFTTKEMLELESKMLTDAAKLKDSSHITLRSVDYGLSRDMLAPQQKDALEHITGDGDLKCLVGYAGTGKSHLLGQAKEIWEKDGYRVHGATLSGIAAENLEAASGIESRTLASRSYYWDRGEERLTKKDVLVIDEAGMLGTRQVARVLGEARDAGAKAVFIGDPQQLQAIEAGAAFRAVSEQAGFLELTEIKRQQEPWQQKATKEFALQHTDKALSLYEQHDRVHEYNTQALAKTSLIEMWNDNRTLHPDKTQIMLSYTRKDAQELNEMARGCRKENNEIGENHKLQTSGGSKEFSVGDRIYFLQNDRGLNVKNGTLGTIERIERFEHVEEEIKQKVKKGQITVVLDKENHKGNYKEVTFNLDQYNHIAHGYAATIHKAQGVTVDNSYVLASKHLDSHAIYVGMSRHKERADLFWSKEEFANKKDLEKVLGRDRSKDIAHDHLEFGSESQKADALLETKLTIDPRDDFNVFQERFEQEHPKLAAEAREEMATSEFLQEQREDLHEREEKKHELFLGEIDPLGQAKQRNTNLEFKKEEVTIDELFDRLERRSEYNKKRFEAIEQKELQREQQRLSSMSPQERHAEKLIEMYYKFENRYHKIKEAGRSRYDEVTAKGQMKRHASKICNDKYAMDYAQKNDTDLFKELEKTRVREQEKVLERGMEKELTL